MTLSGTKQTVAVGDIVSVLIRRPGRVSTDIQAEVIGVRADYANQDLRAILVSGIDQWIVLDDNTEIGLV